MSIDFSKLTDPFQESDIEWRIGRAGKSGEKVWATCLAYVTNRAIMERLDEVCGVGNWKNEFQQWTVGNDHGVKCGISIRIDDEWVTKYDGAQPSNMEPIKGAFSDSMKRAAVQWGIGRYLYSIDEGFATIVEKGKPGAKYGRLPKEAGGTPFYWLPPSLKAGKTEAANLEATPKQLQTIKELAEGLDVDLQKVYDSMSAGKVPNNAQATQMIPILKGKLNQKNQPAS